VSGERGFCWIVARRDARVEACRDAFTAFQQNPLCPGAHGIMRAPPGQKELFKTYSVTPSFQMAISRSSLSSFFAG